MDVIDETDETCQGALGYYRQAVGSGEPDLEAWRTDPEQGPC